MATRQLVSEHRDFVLFPGSMAMSTCIFMRPVFSPRSSSCWIFAL